MTAYLLTIGDEILIGQIVDTNSAWMSRALNLRGIRVVGSGTVADDREAIVAGVQYAAAQADVVLLTGGLGPTRDDHTKQTLADFFGFAMAFHQETFDRIAAYFARIERPLPPSSHQQATQPVGATILTNKVGAAPGLWFERDGKIYVAMPGVPFEMEYLMTHEVLPRLLSRLPARPIAHRTLLTAGEGESNIARRIEAFEDGLPTHVKLAYLPGLGQVRLRLTGVWEGPVTPSAEAELNALLDAKKSELAALLPDLLYGYEDDTLEKVVGQILLAQGKQFGTAESCTGGYVAHLITSVPGASRYFPGAAVTYSYDLKTRLLGVQPETLTAHGAVSEPTVREMVLGALHTLGVDVAVAISGIAGPDGGTPDKPVGTVWMAVGDRERTVAARYVFGRDRLKNIQLTGTYALNLVRKFLLGEV